MNEAQLKVYVERARLFLLQLKNELFLETMPMTATVSKSKLPVPFQDRLKGKYKAIKENEMWGSLWESGWFHLTAQVPEQWAGKTIALKLELGGEILLFNEKGVPFYGLTNTSVFAANYRKNVYRWVDAAKAGQKLDLYAEVGANGLLGDEITPGTDWICDVGSVRHLKMGILNVDAWQLVNDFEVLYSKLETVPVKNYRYTQMVMALNEAVSTYNDTPANAAAARETLKQELGYRAGDAAMETTAVGHAHIDTGWLWPVRETIRKCARTFASQLTNMEKYPGYVFGASQAQLYAFTKEYYPELYSQIKKRVAEGRWEIQGGMWVEADCNIISGESMVRQFVHGKNFFKDEFNVDVNNLWLPDVFGYSAAMPQIIKKSGCDYFLTQKISWSQFNKFPYHSFLWRGIDNTEVLTHFPPEDNYNSALHPAKLNYAQNNFNESYIFNEFMTLFGVGNGGGGPKEEHIENGLRCTDLEGVPKVKFGRADHFFARLNEVKDSLPNWVGELYLELHRGTLTTQARTKRNNRKCEQALALTEFLASCLPAADYPAAELEKAWKTVLINQFHDIIPGSSIKEVYDVTQKEHAEVLTLCDKLIAKAAAKLFKKKPDSVTVFNTLSYDYTSPVALPADWKDAQVTADDGTIVPVQTEADGTVWALGNFPPQSFTVLTKGKKQKNTVKGANDLVLENDLVRYEFDHDGKLLSGFDKETNRDLLTGAGNLLALYVDRPNNWDAWDVDLHYTCHAPEYAAGVAAKKTVDGSVRQKIDFELTIGSAKIRQQAVLAANSKRLDFVTQVDWRESHKMLRVSFPTTVVTPESTCDIQYGFVKRPTHTNTSWDIARFEFPAHRYVDLSDANGGVALLNDCKYGYKVVEGVLDLNLLRSPKYPDPVADMGNHEFTYSLLPHAGGLVGSEVMQEAACLNRAPAILPGDAAGLVLPCALTDADGVTLEVLKKAEKGNDLVIRLVETNGRNSRCTLAFAKNFKKLTETNLVEWTNSGATKISKNQAVIELKPFEIKTFKLS